jgi:hypothetical protein
MTRDFMDLAALEKLAAAPEMTHHAAYLAADIQRLLPALGDPSRALSALQTLQKWAGAEGESLRKGFATAFLERAKAALGHRLSRHPHRRSLNPRLLDAEASRGNTLNGTVSRTPWRARIGYG